MPSYTSRNNKYTLTQTGNRLTVDYVTEPSIVKTTAANGGFKQEVSTYREVFHADRQPHTTAYVNGNDWDIDTQAGFCRWSGTVSNREFCLAMRRLGLSQSDYNSAIRLARAADKQDRKARAARDLAYA
ncbi:MAG TPA: hypothetical protein VGK19_18140 [Capsulimonadaceae bacterium]|jgi:hypothetical protein